MTNDQRRLKLMAIAASSAQTLATTISLAQGASAEEAMRIHARAYELLERGPDAPVDNFNTLVRGIMMGTGAEYDHQVRTRGTYAERCGVAVAEMTRIALLMMEMSVPDAAPAAQAA